MSEINAYDPNSEWLKFVEYTQDIDYFFTQRRVQEFEEYLEPKTLDRKKKKINVIHNFLAINFPNNQFKNNENIIIDIEIWGDVGYNYRGILCNKSGEIPHLLLKLENDKELFIKLIYKENDKILKTFTKFIQILKRYQSTPEDITTPTN